MKLSFLALTLVTLPALPATSAAALAVGTIPAGEGPLSTVALTFCHADPVTAPCPCGGSTPPGHGCGNSLFPDGAQMLYAGDASLGNDTLVLAASSLTGPVALFYQGSAAGSPVTFDDGLNCVMGTIVRIGTQSTAANFAQYPGAGDVSLSVRGGVAAPGTTTFYQCLYRNAVTSFCPPGTSNRTNGLGFTWRP